MSISTTELKKAVLSLEESLLLNSNASKGSPEQKAFRDACIQRFEYSIELAWKVSIKSLGSQTAAAKPAIREMGRNNLILDVDEWLNFIEARNETSHTYNEESAKKIFAKIIIFPKYANALIKKIDDLK